MTLHSNSNTDVVKEALQRKEETLKKGGNAPIPHSIGREVLPLLVSQDKKYRDAIVLYVYLLSHVNGDRGNNRYMSAWTSQAKISEDTGIDKNRIKKLADLLEGYGLIKTEYEYSLNKREKLYYPMYSPIVISIPEVEQNSAEKEAEERDGNGLTIEELQDYL